MKRVGGIQIILFVVVLLVGIYITDLLIQRTKPIRLQLFVANDDQNIFEAKKLEYGLSTYLRLSTNERIIVDDSLYVVFGSSDRYVESSLSKIYAYMAAKELDILIAPMEVVKHYAAGLPMLDYPTLLSDEPALLDRLSENLVSFAASDGEEKLYLLDLSKSRYAHSNASHMAIPASAPHADAIIAFLRYLFPGY